MELQVNLKLAFILLVFLFLIFPTLMLVVFFKRRKVLKIFGIISFILYCVCMSLLVFGSVSITKEYAILNFNNKSTWFSSYFIFADFGKTNIIYNLVMLFPISAVVFSQTEKHVFLKTVLTSFLVSLIIELFQFILPIHRCTEIFDLVTNTTSGAIGYIYFAFVYYLTKHFVNKKQERLNNNKTNNEEINNKETNKVKEEVK